MCAYVFWKNKPFLSMLFLIPGAIITQMFLVLTSQLFTIYIIEFLKGMTLYRVSIQ